LGDYAGYGLEQHPSDRLEDEILFTPSLFTLHSSLNPMTFDPSIDIEFDSSGLVPAIVQDSVTSRVLMLAYVNRESLEKMKETGETWFWSRSRNCLWHKGETSGNTQRIVSISLDCDGDTLLILVEPRGPACHTGETTCFFRPLT
jgi:phosphoribosyl-AMP cyclohydrolase